MPMVDAYADSTLFPKESPKALGLGSDERPAPRRGRDAPGAFHLRNTAAFLNLMEEGTMTTVLSISAGSKT